MGTSMQGQGFTALPVTRGETVKLYGARSAPCTAVVLACLHEMGFQCVFFDMEKKEKLAKQAFAVLPVVRLANGRVMYGVKPRHIIELYEREPFLLGRTSEDKESVEKWLDKEGKEFMCHANALFYQPFFSEWLGPKPDKEVLEKLGKVLEEYEKRLSENKYLAGGFYSLADLIHLPYIEYIMTAPDKEYLITKRKHVKAWWEDIRKRAGSKYGLEVQGI